MCTTSVCRYCQGVQQTGSSKVCALITTKCCTGVHRLDNIMTVQLYNWSEQSVWSTSLNISMNGLSKVRSLVTTKSKVYTDTIGVENGLCGMRKGILKFFISREHFLSFRIFRHFWANVSRIIRMRFFPQFTKSLISLLQGVPIKMQHLFATTQPSTQNNLKQLLLGWSYNW